MPAMSEPAAAIPADPAVAPVLVRGATCVLPEATRVADVLLEGGRVAAIDPSPAEAARAEAGGTVIDAAGLHLLPGVVDSHVHFREPGLEHKEDLASGSRAAAAGGVTTIFDMPNVSPATTSVARLHAKLDRAARTCLVHNGFYVGATHDNLDELRMAERTPGIKIFIGSSTGSLAVDGQEELEAIFARATLPLCGHCEDEPTVRANAERIGGGSTPADHSRIRDEAAAVRCVERVIDLVRRHGHRFHVLHVSTAGECRLIAEARAEGLPITGEACPHHLLLDESDYERLGTHAQVNPAIKTAADRAAVWEALRDGTLACVVTDHAPHTLEEKAKPYPQSPSGLPAVENSLMLMLDRAAAGDCTLEQVVAWMCEGPCRVWGIPGKGRIVPGADADLVLVDLAAEHVVRNDRQHTRCGWSPWDGATLKGAVVRTIVAGRTVYDRGRFDESVRGREVRFPRTADGRPDPALLAGPWVADRALPAAAAPVAAG